MATGLDLAAVLQTVVLLHSAPARASIRTGEPGVDAGPAASADFLHGTIIPAFRLLVVGDRKSLAANRRSLVHDEEDERRSVERSGLRLVGVVGQRADP